MCSTFDEDKRIGLMTGQGLNWSSVSVFFAVLILKENIFYLVAIQCLTTVSILQLFYLQ